MNELLLAALLVALPANGADLSALARDCESGKAAACAQAGAAYKDGKGVPKDIVQAGLFYMKACAMVDLESDDGYCHEAGFTTEVARKNRGERERLDAALAVILTNCDSGNAKDCNFAGFIHQMGVGREKDIAKARVAYTKACAGGVANGCTNAAYAYQVQPTDPDKFAEFLGKACDAKVAADCALLGGVYSEGEAGVKKDLARAAAAYRRACDLQSGDGCARLALMHYFGEGMKKDLLSAVIYFKKACDLHDARGCQGLGAIYKTDRPAGKKLFEQACAQIGGCADFRAFIDGIEGAAQVKKSH